MMMQAAILYKKVAVRTDYECLLGKSHVLARTHKRLDNRDPYVTSLESRSSAVKLGRVGVLRISWIRHESQGGLE